MPKYIKKQQIYNALCIVNNIINVFFKKLYLKKLVFHEYDINFNEDDIDIKEFVFTDNDIYEVDLSNRLTTDEKYSIKVFYFMGDYFTLSLHDHVRRKKMICSISGTETNNYFNDLNYTIKNLHLFLFRIETNLMYKKRVIFKRNKQQN